MIRKILIAIVMLILIVVIGIICKDITTTNTYADNDRFIRVTNTKMIGGYPFNIFYDKETKVEYGFYAKGGLQPLVDAEGKPLLYEEGD